MSEANPPRPSRAATIAAGLGVAAVGVPLLGIAGNQLGLLAPLGGFYAFALGAALLAPIALGWGGVALLMTRGRDDVTGRERAWVGVAGGILMIGVLTLSVQPGAGVPPINDITTNLADPPKFAPSQLVPDYMGRDMSYPPDFAAQVREAYPDLAPIELDEPPREAFSRALATAKSMGWEITRKDEVEGVFDAKDTTAIFRFVDDVTVRVRPSANGSSVDMRSKSRDGRSDLGANAARIRSFASALETSGAVASP